MHDRLSLLASPVRRGAAAVCAALFFAGAAAVAQTTFEDVTAQSGLSGLSGRLAAWGDYDNDGFPDVMIGGKLFRNRRDGTFAPVRLSVPPTGGSGVWGDYDNDGRLDFYSASGAGILLRNTGGGFEKAAITPNPHGRSRAAAWADANGDGRLDLLVTNYEKGNRAFPDLYYQARGDGTFAAPRRLPAKSCWKGRGVNWADFDNDGDPDFYVSNYRLMPNQLWVNDGHGRFADEARIRGVAGRPKGPRIPATKDFPAYRTQGHTISACWGDLNNDGYLDLVVVNFSHRPAWQDRPMVLINSGPPYFAFADINRKAAAGIHRQESYAKGALGDFDNDRDLDLYITTVYKGDNGTLFANDGTGRFQDVGAATGARGGNSYQVAWVDYDNDGDLDLLAGGRLLRNRGNGNAWVKVRVVGDAGSNRAGIGARVTVTAGRRTFIREVSGGNSGNQNDLTVHVGLETWDGPVDVWVRFPSGKIGQWRVAPRSTLTAKESQTARASAK